MAGTFGRAVLCLLAGAICALAAANAFAQVKATKKDDTPAGIKWYGTAELRHHMNAYYSAGNSYNRQEPSLHVRVQLGAQFYDGLLDVYGTLGAYKVPETLQVLERRPELGADFHLVRSQYFDLVQYNLFELPYHDTTIDPETQENGEMGTITMIGLAPMAKLLFGGAAGKFEGKIGFDGWTKLYSRKQYTTAYADQRSNVDDGEDEGHLGLDDRSNVTTPQPIEDKAMHYRALETIGITGQTAVLPEVIGEISGNYFTKFEPRYYEKNNAIDYDYMANRYSYLRVRLQYQVNERVAVTNEFYDFYNGWFSGQRTGDDRRYRNVARVTVKL